MAEALRIMRTAVPHAASLVEALLEPAAYPHPTGRVELLETHISNVFLAGDFAYKIKKAVRLPFVDFTTLARRRIFCEEELRLNRRTAPRLYLDVVPIAGNPLRVGGTARAVEYAVRMRRFPQDALASDLARRGVLKPSQVDSMARVIASFHGSLEPLVFRAPEAAIESAVGPALRNFREIRTKDAQTWGEIRALRTWTREEAARLAPRFAARAKGGFVREGHGDLHLANIAFIDGEAVPFDCLEFDPSLRRVDVVSDMAFTWMDLAYHGRPRLAARFLGAYLEETGDYEGLEVLRFHAVYRALVRAKVAAIRGDEDSVRRLVMLARRLAVRGAKALFLMHGLPASGKTRASQALLEALGAVRMRSDVERPRTFGLGPRARTHSPPGGGIYSLQSSGAAYERLATLAGIALDAGYPVVMDCASLERRQRDLFREVARASGAGFSIVACRAPDAELRRRLRERRGDASEADEDVLDHLAARMQPLAPDELDGALIIDTG